MTEFDLYAKERLRAMTLRELVTFVKDSWTTITPEARYYLNALPRSNRVDAMLCYSYFRRHAVAWTGTDARKLKRELRTRFSEPKVKLFSRK